MKRALLTLLCLALLLAGCRSRSSGARELAEADIAYAKAAADHNLDQLMTLMDPTDRLVAGGQVYIGKAAVRERWSQMLQDPHTQISWRPQYAEVAKSGELGYTMGSFQIVGEESNGSPAKIEGEYVTIWKKGSDGKWRVIVDTGSRRPETIVPSSTGGVNR